MTRKYKNDFCLSTGHFKFLKWLRPWNWQLPNKDMEDLHKMCARYKRGKGCVLRVVENGSRDIYSVQHGEKLVLNVKRKIIFQDRAKTNNGKACHTTCKSNTHKIYPYMWQVPIHLNHMLKLELNRISCEMEINTRCSSLLINKKQFNKLLKGMLSKKKGGVIQRLQTYSDEVIYT